jgi:hypothetical protein
MQESFEKEETPKKPKKNTAKTPTTAKKTPGKK